MLSAVLRATSASSTRRRQSETLNALITKHLQDDSLLQFAKSDDFTRTSTERGIQRWEHAHLIAALDTLNAYQRDRRARTHSRGPSISHGYRDDPRTRLIELLKRWLRAHAASANIDELEVRRVSGLCRDLLNHSALFPARNPRSFQRTMAEVYEHLQLQLREVLEKDRTCAELAQRAITLSRNLLSDTISYLLLAPTDLRQTDQLPSVEAVALWQSLPTEVRRNLPVRADVALQKLMRLAWQTQCGSLTAALLTSPSAVRLFKGRHAEEEPSTALVVAGGASPAEQQLVAAAVTLPSLLASAGAEFDHGNFKNSGLAGALRNPQRLAARRGYLNAVRCAFDLTYLLGEAFVLFQRVGEGLGDYGMIRTAPWLHPFLQALVEKVHQLRSSLELLNEALEESLVLARARGLPVEKPAPTDRMCSRAHEAIERAVTGQESHSQALLRALEDLRARSAPERLPHVMDAIGDACTQLQAVLCSSEFFAHVGDAYRDAFPKPAQLCGAGPLQLVDCVAPPCAEALGADSANEVDSPRAGVVNPQVREAPAVIPEPSAAEEPGAGAAGTVPQYDSGGLPELPATLSENNVAPGPAAVAPPDLQAVVPRGAEGLPAPASMVSIAVRAAGDIRHRWSFSGAKATVHVNAAAHAICTGQDGVTSADTLIAQVYRCTSACSGFKRHDVRTLMVSNGRMHIYQKGSTTAVKTVVDISKDVDECLMHPGGVLSLFMRRSPQHAASFQGVQEHKTYFFEFASTDVAETFHREIARLRAP